MSSDLNGSADSRPAPVARSEAEWAAIMEDFERSGLSRREFCESRELTLKTLGNWRCRLCPGGGKGSVVEHVPPAASGWDFGLGRGDRVFRECDLAGSVAKICWSGRRRGFGSAFSQYPCWVTIRSSSAPCSDISSLIMSGPMPKARSTRRTSPLTPGWS